MRASLNVTKGKDKDKRRGSFSLKNAGELRASLSAREDAANVKKKALSGDLDAFKLKDDSPPGGGGGSDTMKLSRDSPVIGNRYGAASTGMVKNTVHVSDGQGLG